MNAESFSDIFTYVGKAPKRTPEEEEEIKRQLEIADKELEEQIKEMEYNLKMRELEESKNR